MKHLDRLQMTHDTIVQEVLAIVFGERETRLHPNDRDTLEEILAFAYSSVADDDLKDLLAENLEKRLASDDQCCPVCDERSVERLAIPESDDRVVCQTCQHQYPIVKRRLIPA